MLGSDRDDLSRASILDLTADNCETLDSALILEGSLSTDLALSDDLVLVIEDLDSSGFSDCIVVDFLLVAVLQLLWLSALFELL